MFGTGHVAADVAFGDMMNAELFAADIAGECTFGTGLLPAKCAGGDILPADFLIAA